MKTTIISLLGLKRYQPIHKLHVCRYPGAVHPHHDDSRGYPYHLWIGGNHNDTPLLIGSLPRCSRRSHSRGSVSEPAIQIG